MSNTLRTLAAWALAAMFAVAVCGGPASGDGGGPRRAFVAGELLVSVPHGTAAATVADIAKSVNATVVKSFGALDAAGSRDTYWLRISGNAVPDADTLNAVNTLKQDPRVLYAGVNHLSYPLDSIPNDPRYPEQWHLPLMNMPKAWDIEKGSSSVTVAVIDTGVDVNHPDLQGRLLPGTNTIAGGTPTDLTDTAPHGTHVIGIIAAATNNNIGVAGVTWQNVMVLPIKAGDANGFTDTALIAALQFADKNNVQVVNMSLGGERPSAVPDPTDPATAQILAMAAKGIIFTISAGNSFENGNPPIWPALLAQLSDNILCVASCGPNKEHAFYSSAQFYTTITAPGGDDPSFSNPKAQILSTLPVANGSYGTEQGTSMAAPAAAGVVALMLSVPGVLPSDIKPALIATADTLGLQVPNAQYGYGVIDAYQALLRVAVSITVLDVGAIGGLNNPVETLHPNIRLQIRQITPANLTVTLDGNPVTDYTITNIVSTITDQNGNVIPTRYDVVISHDLAPGVHKLVASGVNPGPPPRTATVTQFINVAPHQVVQGRSLVSIPYYQAGVTPEYYFGTGFTLARWIPDQNKYVFYTPGGTKDAGASFSPPDVQVHVDGDTTSLAPLGIGYWSITGTTTPILTKGAPVLNKPIVISLKGNGSGDPRFVSWNMIGDPFPFDVPFASLLVDTPEGRLSIGSAVEKGYLLPNIYSYDGENGYTFGTLPGGVLNAWSGHWIGVTSKSDIALVVPPAQLTRAAKVSNRSAAIADGWTLRLSATANGLRDTFNFIGTSSRAAAGYDLTKVPKPPMVTPYVSLGIVHNDWGGRSGVYAQDLRPRAGVQSWEIAVSTDQRNTPVTVSWDGGYRIPRNVKLVLRDEATGEVVDMRTRASVTFNSGDAAAPRRFSITAQPATGTVLRISSLTVRPAGTRASGVTAIGFTLSGDATYEVKILSATGQSLGTIASRAAGAGDVHLIWNGKDSAGRSVPAGTYIIQVRAVGPDGDAIRAIQPFAVLR